MIGKNDEIFKGKTFSDLLKDIYNTSKSKERQINVLIGELKPLIKNIADAGVIVPLIANYLDIGVQNDEHLVKLAAVVQRAIAITAKNTENGNDYAAALTDDEKKLILGEIKKINESNDSEDKKIEETKQKVNDIIGNISDDEIKEVLK